jgi:hypothetical protein
MEPTDQIAKLLENLPGEERARSAYALLFEHADLPVELPAEGPARVNLQLLSDPGAVRFLPAVILMASAVAPQSSVEAGIVAKLKELASTRGEEPCTLHDWSGPVALAWPLRLALTKLGDAKAKHGLLESIHPASAAEKMFLLDCIHLVNDPQVLHQIASACLGDEQEILQGVPFGAWPKRRLADYAVDQLTKRLKLPVSFKPGILSRYSEAQIEETARLVRQSIPS